ncbi:CotG/ExsB N-terminal domain-containing protein [Bacillus sp. C1]
MKRDIQKAVEEIKSAGMEEFLHQDPSTFEYDDDSSKYDCKSSRKKHNRKSSHKKHDCKSDHKCPKTECIREKKCTFVTECNRVKKCTFVTKRTHVRVQKWTFVTKVTHEKKCKFVTERKRVKKCTFVTKCVRHEKKHYWTKRSYCKKSVFYPEHDCDSDKHSSWKEDRKLRRRDWEDEKKSSCKRKKFDHFWYKKDNE